MEQKFYGQECHFCGGDCKHQIFATPDGRICCKECADKLQKGEMSLDPNVIILSKDEYEIKDLEVN